MSSEYDLYEKAVRQELMLPANVEAHTGRAIKKLFREIEPLLGDEDPRLIVPVELTRGGALEADDTDATIYFAGKPQTGIVLLLESSMAIAWWEGTFSKIKYSASISYSSIQSVTRCFAETSNGRFGAVEVFEDERWVFGVSGLRPSQQPALWESFAGVLSDLASENNPSLSSHE